MRMAVLSLLAIGCISAVPAGAQSTSEVEYHPRAQWEERVDSAATAAGRTAVAVLGDRGGYRYVTLRRDRTGEVEVHDSWDDLIVIQGGSAMLLHGGTMSGGRQTAPGETRGGTISGGSAQPVESGDVVLVPAGVPHQVQVAPGGSVTYLVVKVQPGRESARR